MRRTGVGLPSHAATCGEGRLDALNLVTGPNGSGKSNLYRALRLLAEIAQGRVIASLAREGGLPSTLWAGPEAFSAAVRRGDQPVQGTGRRNPVSLRLGFASDEFSYAIDPRPPDRLRREAFAGGRSVTRAAADRRAAVAARLPLDHARQDAGRDRRQGGPQRPVALAGVVVKGDRSVPEYRRPAG